MISNSILREYLSFHKIRVLSFFGSDFTFLVICGGIQNRNDLQKFRIFSQINIPLCKKRLYIWFKTRWCEKFVCSTLTSWELSTIFFYKCNRGVWPKIFFLLKTQIIRETQTTSWPSGFISWRHPVSMAEALCEIPCFVINNNCYKCYCWGFFGHTGCWKKIILDPIHKNIWFM